jgi:hypothetical protein
MEAVPRTRGFAVGRGFTESFFGDEMREGEMVLEVEKPAR